MVVGRLSEYLVVAPPGQGNVSNKFGLHRRALPRTNVFSALRRGARSGEGTSRVCKWELSSPPGRIITSSGR